MKPIRIAVAPFAISSVCHVLADEPKDAPLAAIVTAVEAGEHDRALERVKGQPYRENRTRA
jgi:hypothetical protein